MKKLIYCSFALFFFSCDLNNCKEVLISNEEMKWFSEYNLGDTIFFENITKKEVDSFFVNEKYHYLSDCNNFEMGDYQYDQSLVSAKLINKKYRKRDGYQFSLEFSKQLQNDSNQPSFKYITVFNLVSKEFTEFSEFKLDTVFLKSLNKNILVYSFENNSKMRSNDCGIKLLYFQWSKEYGLIRYETENGEIFELVM